MFVDGMRALGHVEGNEQRIYSVGFDWSRVASERVLHSFCECPKFAKGKPCKHLWATLLALAETGPENQPPGKDRLSLRKDNPSSWPDLGQTTSKEEGIENHGTVVAPAGPPVRRTHHARPMRDRSGRPSTKVPNSAWKSQLKTIREQVERQTDTSENTHRGTQPVAPEAVRFLINIGACLATNTLVMDLFEHRPDAAPNARLRRARIAPEVLEPLFATDEDTFQTKVIAGFPLESAKRSPRGGRGNKAAQDGVTLERVQLPIGLYDSVLPRLCETGALGWWDGRTLRNRRPLAWDPQPTWHMVLCLEAQEAGSARLRAGLSRDDEIASRSIPKLLLPATEDNTYLAFFSEAIARVELDPRNDLPWLKLLRAKQQVVFPKEELEEALTTLFEMPGLPKLDAPDALRLSEESTPLQPHLVLERNPAPEWLDPPLLAQLSFRYGDVQVNAGDPRPSLVDWDANRFLRRSMEDEHLALVRLLELGVRPVKSAQGHDLELTPKDLPGVAEPLLREGWAVDVHGTSMRPPSPPALRVESGIDWFELSGEVDFDGDPVTLSTVLAAISRGDRFVKLGDGSQGLLPEAWLETYDSLSKLAHSSSDAGLRFLPSQALLVDSLLTAMPPADVDTAFSELREKLRSFERIKPKKELKSFGGTLRSYQRQGLGWLTFLREFGLGGVLADDMGLGKTVQVLAMILSNRTPSKTTKRPFLVVAPRSVVYNWVDEANRFTPKLRVLEYAGSDREAMRKKLPKADLVVTTYGTLRRDIAYLASVEFDTAILDEAQAIKNPTSQTAKASRLLVAQNRLALTGTPIENHLGELGSLFEFLNPGLLGRLPLLEVLSAGRTASRNEVEQVAEGIRPFILRRTKAEVLKDLPPKTEQVLLTDLRPRQREIYDQLRATYQASLLNQVESTGVGGATMQVLEALLRLRQVACHPGLVKEEWEEAGSAKLDALFGQVSEVLDEGHKLIIFSQFTKLLGFVQRDLEARDINFAYLDGQTRNRGEVVEQFQNDPECNLFLISLKAGGVGLNLTAAGYVFLLDPWWNPAVEAQAIDRAHRIGQNQPVFAYRLIARDTVEEKILELQRSKRQLADAILGGGSQPLSDLTADDLRMLLS